MITALVMILALGDAIVHEPAPEWSPLARVAGPNAIGSPGGTHPIAVDGNVVDAVWAQDGRIYHRRSLDGGLTWTHGLPVTSGTTAQYPCSLERTGKILHLLWPDERNGRWEIYHKRSLDGEQSWGAETCLTPGVDQFRLGTAASGMSLFLVWGSRRLVVPTKGGTWTWGEIYYRGSDDAGATWGPIQRLTVPDSTAMRPSISANGRNVHVAWFDSRDATKEWDWAIYTRRSTDGGRTWEPEVRLWHSSTHARHPEIHASPGGMVCCLWEAGQVFDGVSRWSGDPALYAALSTDQGRTWGKPRRITHVNEPNGWATHIKSYAYGSRIHLAWTDAPDGQEKPHAAYYMNSPDGGRTWSQAERLTSAADGSVGAEGVGGSDSCVVVHIGRGNEIYSRRRDATTTARRE